jgi:geranylgeranyl diphosphate synthase type I
MAMGAGSWMTEVRACVERRLEEYFAAKRRDPAADGPEGTLLIDAVEGLTMRGGKRLRAALVAAGLRAVDEAVAIERMTSVGAAVELLQTYLLIHDDWMDQDDQRRGGQAVHAALRDRLGDTHRGASVAVLAGDMANAYAWELLADASFPNVSGGAAFHYFAVVQQDVLFGQAMDILGASDVDRMQRLKTASYTTRGPLLLGALLGGATDAQRRALADFAEPLGIAFQLRDDLLGTFGDRALLGKPVGNDLRAGKRTSLLVAAERLATDPGVLAPVTRVLGRRDADDEHVRAAAVALEECGARQAVETRLAEYVRAAERVLHDAPFSMLGRAWLEHLVSSMTRRSD